jgi:hypothetical protein
VISDGFSHDRFLVDQLIRPVANLYRVTPLAVGETPAGGPIAFVRQKKLALKEDIRFYADEQETQELFRIKARSLFDIGGARYAAWGKPGFPHEPPPLSGATASACFGSRRAKLGFAGNRLLLRT